MKVLLICSLFASLGVGQLCAQEVEAMNEKASRYHDLLLRRPDSSTLFERFVDSWLDTGSKDGLEGFLKESAATGGGPEWRLLATYQDWMGREEDALQAMTTAIEKAPEDRSLLVGRAKLQARLLNFEAALADLEASEGAAGEEAATLKGTWLARAGRPKEALAAWQEVLAARPDDEELREDLIELLVGEGLYDEAVATGRELVTATKDPYQKALRLLRVAAVEVIAGKTEKGIETYRVVLDMTGEDSWLEKEVLAQVERIFQRAENTAGLRKFYQNLREDHPQRVSLRKGLASQMAANGEVEEAIALFREVLKLTPGDLQNRREFIKLLEDSERYTLALEELAVVLRDSGDAAADLEHMARLYDLMKDQGGLLQTLEKLRALRATDPAGVVAIASLFERYELSAKAEEILRNGRATYPEALEVSEALASHLAGAASTEEQQAEATEIWLGMAEGADAEGLLRVARALLAHRRAVPCFELLASRIGEFPENILLLKQLCDAGLAAERPALALPYAISLARLAETPTELTSGLEEVAKLARRLDLEEAIADFQNQSQETVADWCILSELRELQGDSLASDAALAKASQLEDGPLVLSQRIRILENRGQFQEAIAAVREMIALPKGERPINLRKLVSLLENTGDIESALIETEHWKRIAPGDKLAWIRRSELLGRMGELEQAADELRRAIAKFGEEEEELQSLLATALVQAGDYGEGQRIYRKLYETAEDSSAKSRWIEQLATLAKQENRVEELLEDFERRARRNSREAAPLQALARIYETLNNYEMQRETLKEAIRRKPDELNLHLDLAGVEERAGDYQSALTTLREATRFDSGNKAEQALAEFYMRNGEVESGLTILRGLQGGNPREVELTALALMQADEFQLAQNYLQESPQQDWRLRFLTALALYHQGQKEKARSSLRQLAVVSDEIAGLSPMIPEREYENLVRHMQDLVEHESVVENALFNGMQQLSHQLHQFRENHRRGGWASHRAPVAIQLPGTSAEMRSLAMSFLFIEARKEPEAKRDELVAAIPFPQSAFGIRLQNTFRKGEWYDGELANGNLDLDTVIRTAASTKGLSPETLWKGYHEFQESNPSLALKALYGLSKGKPEDPLDILRKQLALLEKLSSDEKSGVLFTLARNCLFSRNTGTRRNNEAPLTGNAEATEIVRETLFAILAKETLPAYVEAQDSDFIPATERPWFATLLEDTWLRGDAQKFVELANLSLSQFEIVRKRTPSNMVFYNGQLYSQSSFFGSSGNANQETPRFPRAFQDGPYALIHFFRSLQTQNSASINHGASASTAAFRKKWLAHKEQRDQKEQLAAKITAVTTTAFDEVVDDLSSPFLRVLALNWSGNDEKLAKEMALFSESNDPEKLLWAAGYYFSKAEIASSYRLLAKARFLPLDQTERQSVDLQLTFLGSQLVEKKIDPENLEIARHASLRTRNRISDPNQEARLQAAMTTLGLGEVVTRMQNARLRRGVASSPATNRRSIATSPRFEQALADGQKDAAAREAFRLFKVMRQNSNLQYMVGELFESIQASGIQDQLLALAKPGDSHRQRLIYLELCDQLNRPDLTAPVAREILAAKLDDSFLAAKISRYLSPEERKERIAPLMNAESLESFTELIRSLAFEESIRVSIRNPEQANKVLEAARLSEEYLTTIEPDGEPSRNLSWVLGLFSGLAEAWYLNNAHYPELDEPLPDKEALAKLTLQNERLTRVKGLLHAALAHPQLASQAFAILEGGSELYRPSSEELVPMALKALALDQELAKDDSATQQWNSSAGGYQFSLANTSTTLNIRWIGKDPQSFLLAHYYRSDEQQQTTLLATLKDLRPKTATNIVLLNRLASGSEEEAADALAQWKEQASADANERASELVQVLSIASMCGAPESRTADLEREYFQLLLNTPPYTRSTASESFPSLLATRYEFSGESAYTGTLHRFLLELIGPPELWPEWIALSQKQGLPNELMHWSQFLQQMIRTLTVQAVDLTQLIALTSQEPLVNSYNGTSNISQKIRVLFQVKSASEFLTRLDEYGFWTKPWSQIAHPLKDRENNTIWDLVLKAPRLPHSTEGKDLKKLLSEASGEHQFRKRLAALSLDSGQLDSFLPQLDAMAPTLLTLPKSEQIAISSLLLRIVPNILELAINAEIRELFQAFKENAAEDAIATARQTLEKGFGTTLEDYHGRNAIFQETYQLLSADPEFAAQYFIAAIQHTLASPSQHQNVHSRSTDYFADLENRIPRDTLGFLDWINFQAAVDANGDAPPRTPFDRGTSYNDRFRFRFVSMVRSSFTPEQTKAHGGFVNFWTNLPTVLPQEKSLRARKLLAVDLLSYDADRGKSRRNAVPIWRWLSTSDYAAQEPHFYRSAVISIALTAWEKLPAPARQAARSTLVELLGDPELAPNVRFEALKIVTNQEPRLCDTPEGVEAVTAFFELYQEKNYPFDTREIGRSLQALVKLTTPLPAERWHAILPSCVDGYLQLVNRQSVDSNHAQQIFTAAIRLNDRETMRKMLNICRPQLRGDLGLMCHLITVQEPSLAKQLLVTPDQQYRNYQDLRWDDEMAETVARLLPEIDNAGERYRIESLLTGLTPAKDFVGPDTNARLLPLVARFQKEAPKTGQARLQCLASLARTDETILALATELKDFAERYSYAQAVDRRTIPSGFSTQDLEHVLCSYFHISALEGDFSPVVSHIRDLLNTIDKVQTDWYSKEGSVTLLGTLLGSLLEGLTRDENPARITPEILQLSREWYQAFAASEELHHDMLELTIANFPFALHALVGKSAEFDQWVRALPAHDQRYYLAALKKGPKMMNAWSNAAKWRRPDRSPERIHLFKALLEDHFAYQTLYSGHHATWQADKGRLITLDDYWAAAEQVAPQHPDGHNLRLSRAVSMAWHKKGGFAEMQEMLQEAIEADEHLRELKIRCELITILTHPQDDPEAAIAMFDSIDWSHLPEDDVEIRKWVDTEVAKTRKILAARTEQPTEPKK